MERFLSAVQKPAHGRKLPLPLVLEDDRSTAHSGRIAISLPPFRQHWA